VVPFKEQVAYLAFSPYGVPITLTSGFHGCSLSNVGDFVNLKFFAVLPSEAQRDENAITIEVGGHIDIDFYLIHSYISHFNSLPFMLQKK